MKSKIRNYQIQTRLGSGSYGVIFKALNKTDKQHCVLKQIRMNKMSEKAKKSTLNEATIMVQYKESFVQDDTLHIIMEYCDNGDLSMYMKMQNKKPLKEQKIWKFFIQICLGLEYIHKNKILHRDIKTLNIFLNKNEDIKIGDLGVAKMLMANDFAQTIVGTPFYLSPQLCEQKPYNQKSDIWALGCLLYELCTFKHPFEAANQASLILKIIRGKYSPIPQFYSKQLKDVIDMCLERDYKRRPTASMILQRSKVRQYINAFQLEQKMKAEYERIKAIKENKQPQQLTPNIEANKAQNILKTAQQKVANNSSKQKQIQEAKRQTTNQKVISGESQNRKISVQKEPLISNQKRPSISGMPEENIILPDKNHIIEKLKPSNAPILPPKKQAKPPNPLLKQQSSQKKIMQNKEDFVKNLEKDIDQNILKRSPVREKAKGSQDISTSAVFQQKSRLQKIDLKIQQQLKKQQQLEKFKIENERKKAEKPSLGGQKVEYKHGLGGDRKSVPALIPRQSNKDLHRYQSNHMKQLENPLIPPLPPKNKQQIIKVKMQQPPVQPKVFETHKSSEQKSKGIIKSKGFSQELRQQNSTSNKIQDRKVNEFKRKSTDNIAKPVLFGLDEEEKQKQQNNMLQNKPTHQGTPKPSQYHSERNIKVISQMQGSNSRLQQKKQPERYIFKKKPQISQVNNSMNSRVRNKGTSNHNELSRNAKNVSKCNQVTKEDEDVVMNLPDSLIHNDQDSSDQELYQNEKEIRMNKNFELKDINNSLVLQKYEQIISSKSIGNSVRASQKTQNQHNLRPSEQNKIQKSNKKQNGSGPALNKNLNDYNEQEQYDDNHFHPQQKISDSQVQRMMMEPSIYLQKQEEKLDFIPQNESLALKTQRLQEQCDQIFDESEQMIDCQQQQLEEEQKYYRSGIQEEIYQVNNFNLNQDSPLNQNEYIERSYKSDHPSSKLTKAMNPSTESQWSFDQEPQLPMLQDRQSPFFEQPNPYLVVQQEEQTIQQKRNYLQIRLQENMKREDEINKLMQIKIQECKSMVPKFFDEILEFFRKKINKQDEYTENDEKEVEQFLRKKGLTDQRKFQNIYKIMHFEMQLENTRKIIQRICKKLSQMDNGKESD